MSDLGLRQVLLVGSGGFLGSVARYVVSGWTYRVIPEPVIPYGTLVVNVLGCLAIGWLGGLAEYRSLLGAEARLFLMVGLLGGFTTFSTFGYEGLTLLRNQQAVAAAAYAMLHLVLGVGAAWIGLALARST